MSALRDTEEARRLALELFDIGAVQFGSFKLKHHETNPDAPLSPIYIDLRRIRSHPRLLRNAALLMLQQVRALVPNDVGLADVPSAGTPLCSVMAAMGNLPMISPRMKRKDHGIQAGIDGDINAVHDVVLVDDLITTAASKLEAIEALHNNGVRVLGVVVLVSRAWNAVSSLGAPLAICMHLLDMLQWYVEADRISPEQAHEVTGYLSQ